MRTQAARRTFSAALVAATLVAAPLADLALHAPLASAAHDATEKIYVAQRGLHNLAVIDAGTLLPTSTSPIALGAAAVPQEVVADPARPFVYVSDTGLNDIAVINTLSDVVETTIPTDPGPQGLTLSSDGAYLYVATNAMVQKIDTRSRAVVASVTMTPFTPWDVTLSNDGARLWVTAGTTTGEVRSLNPSTLAQTDTITPAGAASGAGILGDQLNPSPNSARYADRVNHLLYMFDDLSNTSGSITSSAYVAGPWALASEPLASGADPDKFLVTDGGGSAVLGGDTVYEYDGALGPAQTRSVTNLGGSSTPDSPTEIAYAANATTAYVTLRATNKVSVISYDPAGALAETNVVSLAASADPYGIAVAPSEHAPRTFNGSDRYTTAVEVSQELYGDRSVDALVVARGDAFPDGLAAGPLASMLHGPLLLTKPGSLPDVTKNEIARIFDQATDTPTDL
ncbi:MAG: cell wall-binding repeat-containing protein, partial [Candidatus Andersenbacteria bacterium]